MGGKPSTITRSGSPPVCMSIVEIFSQWDGGLQFIIHNPIIDPDTELQAQSGRGTLINQRLNRMRLTIHFRRITVLPQPIRSLLVRHVHNYSNGLPIRILECRSEERRVGKECRSRWSP